ncbi:MAG: preprotein translocase subunit SecG [bacterium]|nr:preprotein translocase subunit SecG [bacterium]
MLHVLLTIIHILICLVLCAVVLMQSGKGGGLAGAFGGGGGAPQQLLGSRGMTTLLHKITIYCAVGFFVTSFLLFMTDSSGGSRAASSVIGEAATKGQIEVPVEQNPLESLPAPAPAPAETPAQQPQPQGN